MTNGWTGGQYSVYRFVLGGVLAVHFAAPLESGLALALALGLADRSAALALAALRVFAFDPGDFPFVVLLVSHACTPGKPYGAFAARGRTDPGGGWRLPAAILLAHRVAFAVAAVALLSGRFPELSPVGALLLALASLDPGWLPPRRDAEPATLFYDGDCGLCHRAVRFVLAEDRDGRAFRFAPLASEAFQSAIPPAQRAALPDSLVVVTPDGRVRVRTAAVREICSRLGGLWRVLALASHALPERLLDVGYDRIAALRARLFARPAEACPLVPAELRRRFH